MSFHFEKGVPEVPLNISILLMYFFCILKSTYSLLVVKMFLLDYATQQVLPKLGQVADVHVMEDQQHIWKL